jgi:hypothetical protein
MARVEHMHYDHANKRLFVSGRYFAGVTFSLKPTVSGDLTATHGVESDSRGFIAMLDTNVEKWSWLTTFVADLNGCDMSLPAL